VLRGAAQAGCLGKPRGGLSRPSMAFEALALLRGGLSRPSMAFEALALLCGAG